MLSLLNYLYCNYSIVWLYAGEKKQLNKYSTVVLFEFSFTGACEIMT